MASKESTEAESATEAEPADSECAESVGVGEAPVAALLQLQSADSQRAAAVAESALHAYEATATCLVLLQAPDRQRTTTTETSSSKPDEECHSRNSQVSILILTCLRNFYSFFQVVFDSLLLHIHSLLFSLAVLNL